MKLLKIGREKPCNIVLHSDKISALHAELLILDSGEYLLTDKNSTNGTYVGNRRIEPNTEVQVQPGDLIRFADIELNWAYVPKPDKTGDCKQIVNIGTHHRNDIVISGTFASRFHAVLKIAKNGKAFIRDVGSRNGTVVNGTKIEANKDVRIKAGDSIMCGDVDVTDELKPYIPNTLGWIKTASIAALIAAVVVAAVLIIPRFIIKPVKPSDLRPAVAYVRACFHYTVKFEDNPIPGGNWTGVISLDENIDQSLLQPYQASAFFIDREGRLATNRHVAMPWAKEYRTEQLDNAIKEAALQLLDSYVPIEEINTWEDAERLANHSLLGHDIIAYASAHANNSGYQFQKNVKSIIKRLRNSPITISGEMDYLTIGYPGRYYTHEDEFDRCHVVTQSDTNDRDIALLQLNTKKTPEWIRYIFDIRNARTDKLEPLKETLYTIGYPNGLIWALDTDTKSLEPEIREVKCGKVPSKYTFEFQGESVGGASGSPIFDRKGHLVGVLWGGWSDSATFGHACQAKFLLNMYNEEIGL